MKQVCILGSTGSIGESALSVVESFPKHFKVLAISANSNSKLLFKQAKKFKPQLVCLNKDFSFKKGIGPAQLLFGKEGLRKIVTDKRSDIIIIAISGAAALQPLIWALNNSKTIALANKESLVMAGKLVMKKAKENNAQIIPIDSEQSAIWQCLRGNLGAKVRCVYLTASGGPFRKKSASELKSVSVKQVIKHPRWRMGQKISVDSASLMNKGLEIIEAIHLFDLPFDKIKVLVHPESIIHSMVEFEDGVIMAQLSNTDMRIPIQVALSYPERIANNLERIDFLKLKSLNFEKPDLKRFPALSLAYEAAKCMGTLPVVLNAANEIAVDNFLDERIGFVNIAHIVGKVMRKHKNIIDPDLDEIFEADRWAREKAKQVING